MPRPSLDEDELLAKSLKKSDSDGDISEDEYILEHEELSSSDDEASKPEGDKECDCTEYEPSLERSSMQSSLDEESSPNTIIAKCGTVWKVTSHAAEERENFLKKHIKGISNPYLFCKTSFRRKQLHECLWDTHR
ncbi:hypothetical protein SK128_008955 [Halocaridina rubra]|uniref:Uncharacterized protein n=1 Tax=Halocaridina rubra TaxID=373956 RepID=A0AAN9A5B7_HALRR